MPMSAVIIAGGRSRRMNADKALLALGGKALLERVLDVVAPLFDEVLINANAPDAYASLGYPVIQDIFPASGPLGGIHAALRRARFAQVFCVACDMPLLNPALIRLMQQEIGDYDALVPQTSAGWYPLHAMYAVRCADMIEDALRQGHFKVSALFPRMRLRVFAEAEMRRVDPDLSVRININTLEELEAARAKLGAIF